MVLLFRTPVIRPTTRKLNSSPSSKRGQGKKFLPVKTGYQMNEKTTTTISCTTRNIRYDGVSTNEEDKVAYKLGVGYELTGHYEKAICSYSKACKGPDDNIARLNRGLLYLQMEKFEEAITDLAFVIEAARQCGSAVDGETLTGLALALSRVDRLVDAEEVLEGAIELDDWWEARFLLNEIRSTLAKSSVRGPRQSKRKQKNSFIKNKEKRNSHDNMKTKKKNVCYNSNLKEERKGISSQLSALPDKPLTYDEVMAMCASKAPVTKNTRIPAIPKSPPQIDDYEIEQSLPATISILPPPPILFSSDHTLRKNSLARSTEADSEYSDIGHVEVCSPDPELDGLASISSNTSVFARGLSFFTAQNNKRRSARRSTLSTPKSQENEGTFLFSSPPSGNTCSIPSQSSDTKNVCDDLPRKTFESTNFIVAGVLV